MVEDIFDFNGAPVVIANKKWVPNMDATIKEMYKRERVTYHLINNSPRIYSIGWRK